MDVFIHDDRIYHIFRCDACRKHAEPCSHIVDFFKTKDITFVQDNPDVILVSYNGGPDPEQEKRLIQLLDGPVPIIVCERTDPASSHFLSTHTKSHTLNTLHPHLHKMLALFKNFVLTPRELYNQPTILSRYHYVLLKRDHPDFKDDHPITPFNNLCPSIFNKVYPIPWHLRSSFVGKAFLPLRKQNINFDQSRDIDIMCSVSTTYGSYYKFHRSLCLDTIKKLPSTVKKELRKLDKKNYLKTMCNTKICVSPYGLGEFGFRDYEAIYCGALLIKPDCSHVETWPNIYQGNQENPFKTYIPCKRDFSDLNQIIQHILANYNDYKEIRENALKLLLNNDHWSLMDYIASTLKHILCEQKDYKNV